MYFILKIRKRSRVQKCINRHVRVRTLETNTGKQYFCIYTISTVLKRKSYFVYINVTYER